MNRKDFLEKSLGFGCCALVAMQSVKEAFAGPAGAPTTVSFDENEQKFVQNWLTDLLDTIDKELDRDTAVKLIEGCGRGCFNRFQFKQDLAREGAGDVDKLITALKKNFEIWRDGDVVHIRYGETNPGCYCPAARYRTPRENDIHCECTRATHETIWETALGKHYDIDIVETVRRGGKTCHFIVHLA